MTEDKNGVENGEATTEMAPQEDGTKVPLTNDGAEVKFTSGGADNPPNGEAKVDMGNVPTFSGLSKDELMKYSDDVFWVRLRWFLFILFWAGWAAMLIVAIVIIVQAPRCAPKETLLWVQESAMLNYDPTAAIDADTDAQVTPKDMIMVARDLGVTTVYLEKILSPLNFEEINDIYNQPDILALLEEARSNSLHVVTDFVDIEVDPNNVWYKEGNMTDFFQPGTTKLNLTNENLLEKLKEILTGWVEKGVKGFLIADEMTADLENAKNILNEAVEQQDGAVVSGVADMKNELVPSFNAQTYRDFLDAHMNDWSYFKYNPKVADSTLASLVDLVTMSLFMVRGTPVLDGFDEGYLENEKVFINQLSSLREKDSVQVGNMTFVDNTDENTIAFARVLKGTPGYAVAVNMDYSNSTVVDFTSIKGVMGEGEVSYNITNSDLLDKYNLKSIPLGPLEGIILQFVPSF